MTLCTVICSLTDENSERGRKIKQLSLEATMDDGQDEDTDSATSFNELINRDMDYLTDDSILLPSLLRNGSVYSKMLTSQFVKDYLAEC